MLCSRICESLRSLTHFNCVNVNQAALRAVLKPETCHQTHKQHKYPYTSFVWTLPARFLLSPFFNRYSRCLDHRFCSIRSLFQAISIDYKTLELNYFVFELTCHRAHKQHKYWLTFHIRIPNSKYCLNPNPNPKYNLNPNSYDNALF